jgi:hypothetical protein
VTVILHHNFGRAFDITLLFALHAVTLHSRHVIIPLCYIVTTK